MNSFLKNNPIVAYLGLIFSVTFSASFLLGASAEEIGAFGVAFGAGNAGVAAIGAVRNAAKKGTIR